MAHGRSGQLQQMSAGRMLEALERRELMSVNLTPVGTYESGLFDSGGAEIVAYDPRTERAFVVNAEDQSVDILTLRNPANPRKIDTIDTSRLGSPNSVAINGKIAAAAIENDNPQQAGRVAFYHTRSGRLLKSLRVGSLPDMVTFSPDGKYVLVANEGEPSDDYTVDPEGSVSVINIRRPNVGQIRKLRQRDVDTAGFSSFNAQQAALETAGVRIFGPGATVAQDLEPEYITVNPDSTTAYVSLQENNALAVIDLATATVTDILPLGFKDWSAGNQLDASDEDDGLGGPEINLQNWPIFGMYQPDAIASYEVGGTTYIVTANEGDARDYAGFGEEERLEDLTLDAGAFPTAATLQLAENLGRLNVTSATGDTDSDTDLDEIYTFGGRSFSIWDDSGTLIYDSGDDFETITAAALPDYFNAGNDDNDLDSRSDNKGPEPEALAIGEVDGVTYAFIGLERIGGVMVYDISDPNAPEFVQYVNRRDFTQADLTTSAAGDLGPEGMAFVSADDSPNGRALLLVGNEISGTTTVYEITAAPVPVTVYNA